MSWRRPRFTIRSLMIVTVVVAVGLAVAVTLSRSPLFPTRALLLVGPALLLLVHRVLLLGLIRRGERQREPDQPPRR